MNRKKLPFTLDPLDTKLVLPKPKNSVEDETVLALEKENRALYTRKRDGYGVVLVVTGRVRIYTRGSNRKITANVPHIVKELEGARIPQNSVFCGELHAEKAGKDWRDFITSITGEDAAKAVALQHTHARARLMSYNALVLSGRDVASLSNAERIGTVQECFTGLEYAFPVEMVNRSFADAQVAAIENAWEGLVVYDKTKPTAYRLDGNDDRPPRPDGCWKRKPIYEDDFVAIGWVAGTAGKRHAHRMGKLVLAQAHPETGALVPCGEVGIGFSDAEREYFASDKRFPCAVQVEYERRNAPRRVSKHHTQCALTNPRFVRLRDDKTPAACLLPGDLARHYDAFIAQAIRA
ncbi:MAG: hypothetical protein Q8Q39_01715 [bacterium]|nr:hypothetical protein [bacterium]